MDNYEPIATIGEGTYGVVLKARHKPTGMLVAIKKFKESDEDEQVKKTALREIRILKQLKHENIVSLIEVFRRKGKLYLVFEYVERTILEDLEKNPNGIEPADVKRCFFQLLRALQFIHSHNIIHRDIKPENLLVSKNGILKLCDFGFARSLSRPGSKYTEYVATRWYRAPELLVGDTEYGKGVDVWAAGCMFAEIASGQPLFPGDSDLDQLYHIIKSFGRLTSRHMEMFAKNPLYVGVKLPVANPKQSEPLTKRFADWDRNALSLIQKCLKYEPDQRDSCAQLLAHPYFAGYAEQFAAEQKAFAAAEGGSGTAAAVAAIVAASGSGGTASTSPTAKDGLSMPIPSVGAASPALLPAPALPVQSGRDTKTSTPAPTDTRNTTKPAAPSVAPKEGGSTHRDSLPPVVASKAVSTPAKHAPAAADDDGGYDAPGDDFLASPGSQSAAEIEIESSPAPAPAPVTAPAPALPSAPLFPHPPATRNPNAPAVAISRSRNGSNEPETGTTDDHLPKEHYPPLTSKPSQPGAMPAATAPANAAKQPAASLVIPPQLNASLPPVFAGSSPPLSPRANGGPNPLQQRTPSKPAQQPHAAQTAASGATAQQLHYENDRSPKHATLAPDTRDRASSTGAGADADQRIDSRVDSRADATPTPTPKGPHKAKTGPAVGGGTGTGLSQSQKIPVLPAPAVAANKSAADTNSKPAHKSAVPVSGSSGGAGGAGSMDFGLSDVTLRSMTPRPRIQVALPILADATSAVGGGGNATHYGASVSGAGVAGSYSRNSLAAPNPNDTDEDDAGGMPVSGGSAFGAGFAALHNAGGQSSRADGVASRNRQSSTGGGAGASGGVDTLPVGPPPSTGKRPSLYPELVPKKQHPPQPTGPNPTPSSVSTVLATANAAAAAASISTSSPIPNSNGSAVAAGDAALAMMLGRVSAAAAAGGGAGVDGPDSTPAESWIRSSNYFKPPSTGSSQPTGGSTSAVNIKKPYGKPPAHVSAYTHPHHPGLLTSLASPSGTATPNSNGSSAAAGGGNSSGGIPIPRASSQMQNRPASPNAPVVGSPSNSTAGGAGSRGGGDGAVGPAGPVTLNPVFGGRIKQLGPNPSGSFTKDNYPTSGGSVGTFPKAYGVSSSQAAKKAYGSRQLQSLQPAKRRFG